MGQVQGPEMGYANVGEILTTGLIASRAFHATMWRPQNGRYGLVLRMPNPSELKSLRKFGASVRRQRSAINMTQETLAELAELAELHPRTLQKIEAGTTNVLITTAQRIRKALDCPWDSLL